MFALDQGTATVIVAFITMFGGVAVAAIQFGKVGKELRKNGGHSVKDHVTALFEWKERQDVKMARQDARMAGQEARMERVEAGIDLLLDRAGITR